MRWTLIPLALALTVPSHLAAGDPYADPAGVTYLFQAPFLDQGVLDEYGIFDAFRLSDASAGESTAIMAPWDLDVAQVIAVNEVDVWGSYLDGAPPESESFTVRIHNDYGFPYVLICHKTNIPSTREIVGTAFGYDVYQHTLRLPTTCFASFTNSDYWVEIYNDTGPGADWHWLIGGWDASQWDPVWRSMSADETPGVQWSLNNASYSVRLRTGAPGDVPWLRIAKDPIDSSPILQWGEDCGVSEAYSVFRGSLLEGYASIRAEPSRCEVAGTTATVPLGDGEADFFIVSPMYEIPDNVAWIEGKVQGSFGFDSTGQPRDEPGFYLDRCAGAFGFDECAP